MKYVSFYPDCAAIVCRFHLINADCGQICRGNGPATSTSTPQIRQSLRKQAFEITSTVNYTQNENLTLARLIEDQVFGETCDRHAAGATKFVCREATAWPNSRTLSNPQQRPALRCMVAAESATRT